MFHLRTLCLLILAAADSSLATAILGRATNPSVTIKNGTVIGQRNSSIDHFIGIPFAQPPVGKLRLQPPQALTDSFGRLRLPSIATACPQMNTSSLNTSAYPVAARNVLQSFQNYSGPEAEDCLTINIQRPANLSKTAKLPVLFWIYGGGFEIGSTAQYDGTNLVTKSVNMSSPLIYVTANYRLNAFGFLHGKQLQEEGSTNLGLRDQRKALEWVADNIAAFGGDPDKVTIWGESAGSASVFDHLLINNGDHHYNGKPLFRGAIMDSGSVIRTLPVNSTKAQSAFDTVASAAGCSNTTTDVLSCLRSVPYLTLKAAANSLPDFISYSALNIPYYPRPDPSSSFFPNTASQALASGSFARVPIIIGDQQDEGTLFSLSQTNLSTTSDLVDYYSAWFPTTPRDLVAGLVATYPDDPAAGSPFDTGDANNELYPQFKRNAAIQGDYIFTLATRRMLVGFARHLPGAWAYLATYLHGLPLLGTYHTSDIGATFGLAEYGGGLQAKYYINFVSLLNPNGMGVGEWPKWDERELKMLNISAEGSEVFKGDFRNGSYEYVVEHRDAFFL